MVRARADYWKSQDRKFCDFCKCWLADNKPSVDFHERGKRHKENVEKRIKEISKKSQRDHKAQQRMDHDIKKMEQAAMKAYMLDVHAKADFSSQFVKLPEGWKPEDGEKSSVGPTVPTQEQAIPSSSQMPRPRAPAEVAAAAAAAAAAGAKKLPAAVKAALPKAKPPTLVAVTGGPVKHVKNYVHQKKLPRWYEAKNDEGNIYYWNTITQATSWEKPADGYVSLELQAKHAKQEEDKMKKKEEQWDIMRNPLAKPLPPSEKKDPYGSWKTIEPIQSLDSSVDLQLPQVERVELQVPVLEQELPQVKFKEKLITSLEGAGCSAQPTVFKKRKIQHGNSRRRGEDD